MSTPNDVLPVPSPAPQDNHVAPAPAPAPNPSPNPGEKTPPENLKAALDEERRLRKDAEERARLAEEALLSGEVPNGYSDEGKLIIEQHVKPLAEQVTRLTDELTLKQVIEKYPALSDKQSEFTEYRKAHPGYSSEDVATLFLNEHGLLAQPPRRPGLEEPRGGDRTPAPVGMSSADIDKLRLTDYKQYLSRLRKGEFDLTGNS